MCAHIHSHTHTLPHILLSDCLNSQTQAWNNPPERTPKKNPACFAKHSKVESAKAAVTERMFSSPEAVSKTAQVWRGAYNNKKLKKIGTDGVLKSDEE